MINFFFNYEMWFYFQLKIQNVLFMVPLLCVVSGEFTQQSLHLVQLVICAISVFWRINLWIYIESTINFDGNLKYFI